MAEPKKSERNEVIEQVLQVIRRHKADDYVDRSSGIARQNHTAAYHSGFNYAIQVFEGEIIDLKSDTSAEQP